MSRFAREQLNPDKGIVAALESIKANPNFKRLLNFQLNTLIGFLTLPNPKHRENAHFVLQTKSHVLLITALEQHASDDFIVLNSAVVLEKLIGKGSYREESIIEVLMEAGIIEAINTTLRVMETQSASKESFNQLLTLTNTLISNPAYGARMIAKGTVEHLIGALRSENLNESSHSIGVDTLNAFLAYPSNQLKVIQRNIIPAFCSMLLDCILAAPCVLLGFKFIQKIIQTPEGLEYVKKCDIVRPLVSIMSCFSKDSRITNMGCSILSRIITEERIEHALNDLKKQSNDLAFHSALLSNLVLSSNSLHSLIVNGDMLNEVLRLIGQFRGEEVKNFDVLKNCFVTVTRIANLSNKQAKQLVCGNGIDILADFIETDHTAIFVALIETFEQLINSYEGAFEIIVGKHIISTIIEFASTIHADHVIVGSALAKFMKTILEQPTGCAHLVQNNAVFLLQRVFKAAFRYKTVVESVMRTLSIMVNKHAECAKALSSKAFLEQVLEICNEHPEWRRFCEYSLSCLLSLLTQNNKLNNVLREMEVIETLVSIVSNKAYVALLNKDDQDDGYAQQAAADIETRLDFFMQSSYNPIEYDSSELEELQKLRKESKDTEEGSPAIESSILSLVKRIAAIISSIDDVMSTSEQIENMSAPAMSSPEISLLLEISLFKLAIGIAVFPQDSLDMGVQHPVFQLVKQRISSHDILATLSRFFSITGELFESSETQSSYSAMLFVQTFFDLTAHILTSPNSSAALIIISFDSLRTLINRVNPASPKTRVIQSIKPDQRQNLLNLIAEAMRKYIQDFQLQQNAIDLVTDMASSSTEKATLFKGIEDSGMLKFIVTNLSLFIDISLGLKCFSFIEAALKSQVPLILRALHKLRTLNIIMGYIISMNNAPQLRSAATYIIQELSEAANQAASSASNTEQSFIENVQEEEQATFKTSIQNNSTNNSSNSSSSSASTAGRSLVSQTSMSESKAIQSSPANIVNTNVVVTSSEESQDQLVNLVERIDPESKLWKNAEFSMQQSSEALESITNSMLIERNVEGLVGAKLVIALNNLIGYLNMQDENDFALQGKLFVADRMLIGAMQLLVLLLQSQGAQRVLAVLHITESMLVAKVLYVFRVKQHANDIIQNAAILSTHFLEEEILREDTLTTIQQEDYAKVFLTLFDRMNSLEETQTASSILQLILSLVHTYVRLQHKSLFVYQASMSAANADKLIKRDFIRSIMIRISLWSSTSALKSVEQLSDSIRCLSRLSEYPKVQEMILAENGVETLFMILKHQSLNETNSSIEGAVESVIHQTATLLLKYPISNDFIGLLFAALSRNSLKPSNERSTFSQLFLFQRMLQLPNCPPLLDVDQRITEIKQIFATNQQIVHVCNEILRAFKSEDQVAANKQAVISLTQAALKTPAAAKAIQQLTSSLSGFHPNESTVVSSKINTNLIEQISKLLLTCSDSPDLIKETLLLLVALSQESNETSKAVVSSEIPSGILAIVKKHSVNDTKSTQLIQLCFNALNSHLRIVFHPQKSILSPWKLNTVTGDVQQMLPEHFAIPKLEKLFADNQPMCVALVELKNQYASLLLPQVLEYLSLSTDASPSKSLSIESTKGFLNILEKHLAQQQQLTDESTDILEGASSLLGSCVGRAHEMATADLILRSDALKQLFESITVILTKSNGGPTGSTLLQLLNAVFILGVRLTRLKLVKAQDRCCEAFLTAVVHAFKKINASPIEFIDPFELKTASYALACMSVISRDSDVLASAVAMHSAEKVFVNFAHRLLTSLSNNNEDKTLLSAIEQLSEAVSCVASFANEGQEVFKSTSQLHWIVKQLLTKSNASAIIAVQALSVIANALKSDSSLRTEAALQFKDIITKGPKLSYKNMPCVVALCEEISQLFDGKVVHQKQQQSSNTSAGSMSAGTLKEGKAVAATVDPSIASTMATAKELTKDDVTIADIQALIREVETSIAKNPSAHPEPALLQKLLSSARVFCEGDVDRAHQVQGIGLAELVVRLGKSSSNGQMSILLQILNCVYQFPKVVAKSKMVPSVIEIISAFLSSLSSSKSSSAFMEGIDGFKHSCIILSYAGPFASALQLIHSTKIVSYLIALTLKLDNSASLLDSVAAQALEALAKICSSKQISQQFLEVGGDGLLEKEMKSHPAARDDERKAAACYLLGKVSQNSSIQARFSYLFSHVISTLKGSRSSTGVLSKGCFALASMVFNNEKCALDVLSMSVDLLDFLDEISKQYLDKQDSSNDLLSNICMLINSLCYKNTQAKKIVGLHSDSKVITMLLMIAQSKAADGTVQQAFKSLGNLSLFEQNSIKMIEKNLLTCVIQVINDKLASNLELCTFFLEILLNVCAVIKKVDERDDAYALLIRQDFFKSLFKYIESEKEQRKLAIETICCTIQSNHMCIEFCAQKGVPIFCGLLSQNKNSSDLESDTNILRIFSQLASTLNADCTAALTKSCVFDVLLSSLTPVSRRDSKYISKSFKLLQQLPSDPASWKLKIVEFLNQLDLSSPSLDMAGIREFLGFILLSIKTDEVNGAFSKCVLSPMLTIFQDKMEDLQAIEHSIDIIEQLAMNKKSLEAVMASSVLTFLCEVLKKFLVKQQLSQKVLRCLEILASTSDKNQGIVAGQCIGLLERLQKETQKEPAMYKMILNAKQNIQKGSSAVTRQSLVTPELKEFVLAGTIARLYKENGTSSKLKVTVTPDLMELNCKKEGKQLAKPKWKIPINMIQSIKSNYETDAHAFAKSHFASSFRKSNTYFNLSTNKPNDF